MAIIYNCLCYSLRHVLIGIDRVLEQPIKIPFLAAVILHANDLNSDIGTETLRVAVSRLSHSMKMGHWRNVKLLLRFLACVHEMIEGDGMFTFLNTLFQRAADQQAESPDDTFGLELVKIILLTIPYLVVHGPKTFHPLAAELLNQTAVVASAPPAPIQELSDPYPGLVDGRPFEFQPILALLQTQITKEAENGWEITIIPRPYAMQKRKMAESEDTKDIKGNTTYPLPVIEVPEKLNPGNDFYPPASFFSVYAGDEVESVPRIDNLASSLIRDVLVDLINILDFNRIWTSKLLLDMDCFWPAHTFAPRKTKFESLKSFESGQSTWKTEDCVVDAIFSQIMSLPAPPHKLVYYHSVITEACKLEPSAIAPSLGRAIRFFYRHISDMDRELEYRFMDWFSHHLSNFDFRWKWNEWVEDTTLPDIHPRKSFLNGVLDKEVRLSYAKRIRETLPLELADLIPEGKDEDTPKFRFASSDEPFASDARDLLQLVKKKATPEDVQPVLDIIKDKAESAGLDPLLTVTDVYMLCILVVGSKSLSHVISAVERHKEFLLSAGRQSERARCQITTTVVDYWKNRPGTAVGIVDKLLNYTIVTPASVVEWSFGPETLRRGTVLAHNWLYEIVSSTINKVTTQVRQIRDAIVQSKVTLAPEKEIESLEEIFKTERDKMNALFDSIQTFLERVTSGQAEAEFRSQSQSQTKVETADDDDARADELKNHIAGWAFRWSRVFERKSMVANMVVSDDAVETAIAIREMIEAESAVQKKADRDEEEAYRRQRERASSGGAADDKGSVANGSGSASVDPERIDHAPITGDFDPTNGMVCDVGPGSANSKVHED